MTSRFQEPKEDTIGLIIGTYILEGLYWQRQRPYDQIVTQEEVDEGFFSVVEFDLEWAPDCDAELMKVRAYRSHVDHAKGIQAPISAGLQEVFSQYLQDDPQRWRDAKNWLESMGEPIGVCTSRRAA